MKLKDGFVLREVAGQTVVLPTGDELNLNMMITLNDTGKFIWNLLSADIEEAEIVSKLLSEYDVDQATAENAVAGFIKRLREHGFLAE